MAVACPKLTIFCDWYHITPKTQQATKGAKKVLTSPKFIWIRGSVCISEDDGRATVGGQKGSESGRRETPSLPLLFFTPSGFALRAEGKRKRRRRRRSPIKKREKEEIVALR